MNAPHAPSTVGRRVLRATRERGADGSNVEVTEWLAGPGWTALPVHDHDGDERYEILGGRVSVVVDGASRTYRAGESVIVAAGRSHTLESVDGHGLHVRVELWSPLPLQSTTPTP
jgi:mannose-6-phosphate isomerase-like protein (cupin superfamily)